MKVFGDYAKYYDIIYRDKDYSSETEYVKTLLKKFSNEVKTILDLGCGTGKHACLLAEMGFTVTGVEVSEEMHRAASARNECEEQISKPEFLIGDIRNIEIGMKFDAVIMLFHVMSYQTANDDVNKAMKTVTNHLRPGGIFVFDFWYGPAVLIQKPERRLRIFSDPKYEIKREAIPEVRLNDNIVNVVYEIEASNYLSGQSEKVSEAHCMRYFFLPELDNFLENAGLSRLHSEEWMTGNELSEKSWSGVCIAGKR